MLKNWRVASLAFLAMFATDVAYTVMVVYESRLNGPVSGLFDVVGWFFSLICSALAIDEIVKHGWKTRKSLAIIAAICLANFVGTVVGVDMAKALS